MLSTSSKLGQSVMASRDDCVTFYRRDDESYRMNHGRRGLALIFNHFWFDAKLNLSNRSGTEVDKARLKSSLSRLGFDVQATKKTFYLKNTILEKPG